MSSKTHSTVVAARLRVIADLIERLGRDIPTVDVSLFLPGVAYRPTQYHLVDEMSVAMFDKPAETYQHSSAGSWYYGRTSVLDGVELSVRTVSAVPAEEDPAVLRAQVEELRAQLAAARGEA